MISVGGSRLNSQRLAPVFVSSRHLCFKDLFRSFLTVFLYYQFFFFRLYESDVKKKFTFRQALLESQPGKPDPPFADPHEGWCEGWGVRPPATRLSGSSGSVFNRHTAIRARTKGWLGHPRPPPTRRRADPFASSR
jgi:hypothetical protein